MLQSELKFPRGPATWHLNSGAQTLLKTQTLFDVIIIIIISIPAAVTLLVTLSLVAKIEKLLL